MENIKSIMENVIASADYDWCVERSIFSLANGLMSLRFKESCDNLMSKYNYPVKNLYMRYYRIGKELVLSLKFSDSMNTTTVDIAKFKIHSSRKTFDELGGKEVRYKLKGYEVEYLAKDSYLEMPIDELVEDMWKSFFDEDREKLERVSNEHSQFEIDHAEDIENVRRAIEFINSLEVNDFVLIAKQLPKLGSRAYNFIE